MAGENTVTTLNANFKILYGDKLQYLMPKNLRLIRDFRWKKSARIGRAFHQPVVLQHENGFTYAAAGAGAVSFVTAVPGMIENAVIDGSQIFLRSLVDYESAAKGASSKAAFVDTVGYLIENMWESSLKRIEIDLWSGQSGLGVVASGGTTTSPIVTDATWAPGIWAGQEDAYIEATDTAKTLNRSVRTQVSTLNMTTKTPTFAAALTGLVATDVLWFGTQRSPSGNVDTEQTNSMLGMDGILSGPATLHGITSANYSLWQAEALAVGSVNLNLEAIEDAAARVISKGGEGDYNLYHSQATFAKMTSDFAGLRRLAKEDGSKYTIGAKDIEIFAGGIAVTLAPSPYCMEGFAYLANPDDFMRIGASDLTYKVPGRGEDLFRLSDGAGSFELQTYTNQSLMCMKPGRQCRLTGIVNT